MPTYDYKCKKCSHTFEYFHTMSDAPLELCPECKGELRRLISGGSGLIFKGSGFYLTDYANKDSSKSMTKSDEDSTKKPEKDTKKKPDKDTKKPIKESNKT